MLVLRRRLELDDGRVLRREGDGAIRLPVVDAEPLLREGLGRRAAVGCTERRRANAAEAGVVGQGDAVPGGVAADQRVQPA
eukprot:scaffold32866_cov101-Isochrysis_galbana.AAC.5